MEKAAAVLALKPAPGSRNELELVSNTTLSLRDAENEEHTLAVNLKAGLIEEVGAVSGQGIAEIRIKYTRLTIGIKLDDQPVPKEDLAKSMNRDLFKVKADMKVDAGGALIENKLDLGAVPRALARPGLGHRREDPEVVRGRRADPARQADRAQRHLDRHPRPADRHPRRG